MPDYLTTKEVAALLRIKERKVYDLASTGALECSRAMGKLLFPADAVHAWLSANLSGAGPAPVAARPGVFLGSHDPLLDWALLPESLKIIPGLPFLLTFIIPPFVALWVFKAYWK